LKERIMPSSNGAVMSCRPLMVAAERTKFYLEKEEVNLLENALTEFMPTASGRTDTGNRDFPHY